MSRRSVWPFIYNAFAEPVIEAGLYVSAFWSEKAKAKLRGQRRTLDFFRDSAGTMKEKEPRLWFHAASAGEFLQVKPLIRKLRRLYPSGNFLVTFYSPSAESLTRECAHKDIALYLPGDSRKNVRRLLTAFRPHTILFSKYDVWPNLAWESSKMGIKLAIVGATLHECSGRLRAGVLSLTREVHRCLDFVGASTEEDALLYMELDVDPDRIVVTGDMRYDQTYERAMSVTRGDPELEPMKSEWDGKILVAGSTWPDDDRMIIPAFASARRKHGDLKLIIVPHEIRDAQLENIESLARSHDLRTVRYSALKNEPRLLRRSDITLVDEVGFLFKIYALATIAYVGGGFGSGVHNVMEPACYAIPVFIGPRWSGSREASLMLRRAAAFEVKKSDAFVNLLVDILDRESWKAEAGGKALEVVKENLGATDRTISELHRHFPGIFNKPV